MKKIFLFAIFAVFALFNVNSQDGADMTSKNVGLNGTFNVGLPVGDASDFSSFSLSAGLNYQWSVSDMFNVGVGAVYSYTFGKDWEDGPNTIEVDDSSTLILAGGARVFASDDFAFGLDLGYGIGISPEGNDGGFIWSPNVRYYLANNTNIFLSYSSLNNDGFNFDSINLGLEFGL